MCLILLKNHKANKNHNIPANAISSGVNTLSSIFSSVSISKFPASLSFKELRADVVIKIYAKGGLSCTNFFE